MIVLQQRPRTLFGGVVVMRNGHVFVAFVINDRKKEKSPKQESAWGSHLKTNPNFNTNAPLFEVRGCKVILGGAFLGQGGAKNFEFIKPFKLISICYWDY